MLVQGWWVIHLLPDTPCCSLVWVSPRASCQREPGSQTLPVWHQFPFRHMSREVSVVGRMVVTLQGSVVKVFCVCPEDKDTEVDGQWRWLQSLQQVEGNVVCEREEMMRLKETGGGGKGARLVMEDMLQGFSYGVKQQAWPSGVRVVCGLRGCISLQCCCWLWLQELPQLCCTAHPGVQQRTSWGANKDFLSLGWDQVCFPASSHALTNRLLCSLKECTSSQRHPYIVAAFNNSFHIL